MWYRMKKGSTLSAIEVQIKNYQVLNEIGAGGLGKVFKAIDPRTGRLVAIKVLHSRYQQSPRFLGIFHRELLIVSRLKHKHIVEYIDSNFQPPNCYIVAEFVDGYSLHALMKAAGKFPPLVGLAVAFDILQGIDYLHLHDTIHSDLSSPNVLIDKSGRVMVTDFGLACQQEVEDYKSYMVGTPGYYSPEHITDSGIVPQSDIYCVGLLIYEMLTGGKAVPASKDRKEILRNMKKIDLNMVNTTDRKLTALIRRLLKETFAINPKSRIPSAEAMMFLIYRILNKHNIRYARYAIRQFMIDKKLAPQVSEQQKQDIYFGME